MDSKAAFMQMMDLVSEGNDNAMDALQNAIFSQLLGDVDITKVMEKPEIKRLLSSQLMKDAIEATEIPTLQFLYNQIYNEAVESASYTLGQRISHVLFYSVPAFLLVLLFGFLAYKVLSTWKARADSREEKKLIRQLKKENAEAQRRLTQQSHKTKKN